MWKKVEVKGHSALANEIIKYQRKGYDVTFEKSGFEYVLVKGKNKSTVHIVRS